jgi:diguanylate cyclase (GGDEF)-like protein
MRALRQPVHLYVLAVTAAGLAVLGGLVAHQLDHPAALVGETVLLLGVFLVAGELLPVRIPRHEAQVAFSTTFAFALLLVAGIGVAVILQALASLVADVLDRRRPVRAAFNVAQYTLSLAATGWLLGALSPVPRPEAEGWLAPGDVGAVVIAAVAFFVINNVLAGAAPALAQRARLARFLLADLGFQALTAAVLLGLAPIVVVVAAFDPWLVLALLLPMAAIFKGSRDAVVSDHQAFHDALTDMPNRSLFRDRAEQAIRLARRDGHSVAVLLLDLDRFKEINDTLGHHHGDLLLQQIGPRLSGALRESDTIARLGGDEFALLLSVNSPAAAAHVASKVLASLSAPFPLQGMSLQVGASIGIACFPEHGIDVDALLQHADVAMYQAKEEHSGYELYTPEHDHHTPARLVLVGELRRALQTDELVVHYQPKVDLATGEVAGVEALVRWEHPTRGLLAPAEFIALAEHTGLIRPLTLRVLDQALADCSAWRDAGHDLTLAVNLPVRSLLDRSLCEQVDERLREVGLPPDRLEFEITESTIMADPPRAMAVLEQLRELGVGLAIDDFGTGYSSLAYLQRLPVTALKIDRSFVAQMAADPGAGTIVRSTVDLGRNLGLEVVAEGVEDPVTLMSLTAMGCALAQGYHITPPLPAPALLDWLRARASAFRP